MDLSDFHFLIGQTIMYCQAIEHDMKHLYATMLKGDYSNNLNKVEQWTLGKLVNELKKLDFSDNKPYISANDYNFLKQMKDKRNHWCHQAYQNFMYNKRFLQSKEYADECRKLQKDNERFSIICDRLEDVRVQAQKDFRGM